MNPLVTIITPTKNRCQLLAETMDSVQGQGFAAWEHLIVDDGSDDGTAEAVAERAALDPRIRFLRRQGSQAGANVCRNLGLRESRGELVLFLDSDDLLRPHCLARRVELMQRNADLDFAVFRAGVFEKAVGDLTRLYHLQDPGDDLLRFLALECVWEITGPIWRRSFLETIGGFDESLLSMQDLELHVRALTARGKYLCFPDVDHDIRWQDDTTKTSVRHFYDLTYIRATERVRTKLMETVSNSGLLTWTRRRAIIGLCFGAAESWVRAGHLNGAWQAWTRGCQQQQAPWLVQWMGYGMLGLLRLSRSQSSLLARFVNKWKGWVRFRPEPALANVSRAALPATLTDCVS